MNKRVYGLLCIIIALSSGLSFLAGYIGGSFTGYNVGVTDGTQQTLTGVAAMLEQQGIDIAWSHNADGSYTVECLNGDGTTTFKTNLVFHAYVEQYRDGKLLASSYHTMSVTDYGKDWVEKQLFNPQSTEKALYLGCSADSTAFSASWTALPSEITLNGLGRALGTYTSTGVGAANVTAAFSVSGTQATQLYGVYANTYASGQNTLIAAEQQGAGAVKNFVSGDTLTLTVQWSHS